MPRELELKFTTDSPLPSAEQLAGVLSPLGFSLGDSRKDYIKDRYFDDPRASLSRAGLAVRRRMHAGQMLATLKSRGSIDGAVHEREEIELPLPDRGWPQAIADRISVITDPGALKPYTVLDSERTVFPILNAAMERLADLSFDLVTASFQQGTTKVEFLEIELEAAADVEVDVLSAISQRLEQVMQLAPSPFTKLERAQALLLGAGS